MTRVKVNSVDVTLKLGSVVSKFMPMDNGNEIIMGGYKGSFIVDENLHNYIVGELEKMNINPNGENNPDAIYGSNFRPMVCKLYASITREILQQIPITHRIVSVVYSGYDGSAYCYDVEHREFL